MAETGCWSLREERLRSWVRTSARAEMSVVEGRPRSLRRRRDAWSMPKAISSEMDENCGP